MTKNNFKNALPLLALLAFVGCAKEEEKKQNALVSEVKNQAVESPIKKDVSSELEVKNITSHNTAVVSEVTLDKKMLLETEFLYGADLQYSAIKDEKYDLNLQSIAIGHFPARFYIVGNSLQLRVDQRDFFESDVNHPERLIHEFPILAQVGDSIRVEIKKASPLLVTILGDSNSAPARQSFVRRVEFVNEKNLLMAETTIESADGSIADFMETVSPRKGLGIPSDLKPIYNDPSLNPNAERFRFLSDFEVWVKNPSKSESDEKIKTKLASRFLVSKEGTIDWYITPNVPEKYLGDIRTGVEAWNRYFKLSHGRDVVRFAGQLPAGIRLGDPRYNVINWDNIAKAGAAYESQASDATTGIQSHSLIYLPLAWINIGKEYWTNGQLSDNTKHEAFDRQLNRSRFLGRKLAIGCIQHSEFKLDFQALQDPEEFARELLKGVLMHEVGHALGLAHNFKGSLAYDTENASAVISTSVMDYNQYNLEREIFESVDSANGPLLEYDRQILSVLYNGSKDIKETDPVVPACNDEEADSLAGGVDPLCTRYDSGSKPDIALEKTVALVTNSQAQYGHLKSLPVALGAVTDILPKGDTVKEVKSIQSGISKFRARELGLVNFYFNAGAQSIGYNVRANLKSLQIFRPDSVEEKFDTTGFRSRVFSGLQFVAQLSELPLAVKSAIENNGRTLEEWISSTDAFKSQSKEDQDKLFESLRKSRKQDLDTVYEGRNGGSVLTRLRARVLGSIVRSETSPYYLGAWKDGLFIDFEQELVQLLLKGLLGQLNGKTKDLTERVAIAKSLMSFKGTASGTAAIQSAINGLQTEVLSSQDAAGREGLRQLLKLLN